jgi:transposase
VHQFNSHGLEGLSSGWRGRPGRLLSAEQLLEIKEVVRHHPREVGIKHGRWTLAAVSAYIKKTFGKKLHRDTVRNYLHLLGFSHRKPNVRLAKGDPEEQEKFARDLQAIEGARTPRAVTVYVDEGKIQQDALPRKGWFLKGELASIDSTSPGKKKILFYSAVVRPLGKVITQQVDRFTSKNSARFLRKLRDQLAGYRIDLVWDNGPWHNGRLVQKAISQTHVHEHRLPAYSPMMNAAEYFIRWAKEVVSYNFCWKDLTSLKNSFKGFVASLSWKAGEVLRRCKPKMSGFKIA